MKQLTVRGYRVLSEENSYVPMSQSFLSSGSLKSRSCSSSGSSSSSPSSSSPSSSWTAPLPVFGPLQIFRWRVRWYLVRKPLLHFSQMKSRFPSWELRCFFKWSVLRNCLSHFGQLIWRSLQENRQTQRLTSCLLVLWKEMSSKICTCSYSECEYMCCLRSCFLLNVLSQWSHLMFLVPKWMTMWDATWAFWVKDFPHTLHLKFFWPLE